MECVASTLHTTSELGVSSDTTADPHTSAASSRLNWRPSRFKWTLRFAERRNLVSAPVPSHFKRSLPIKLLPLLPVLSPASLRFTLILSSHTLLSPSSDLLASGFRIKYLYEFLFSAMHSTSEAYLIFHLVTLIMFGGYRLPYLSYPRSYEVC